MVLAGEGPGDRLEKLQNILEVARAMTAQRALGPLLELIVAEAATTVSADRATLFLIDRERGELWSKVAQGAADIRLPLESGVAGAVAATGKVVNLAEAYSDPRFHPAVDLATGYRTRTLLAVPMLSTQGEVVGVLEALNRREGAFTQDDQELLSVLAGQAASAVENAGLHEEIERLFESFVRAAVVAIESRDPSTAGHSERVARLSLALAQALAASDRPPYAGLRFGSQELRQLRIAALLHDFGKVGVREQVLLKASRLHPHELAAIRARFDLIQAHLEIERLETARDRTIRPAGGHPGAPVLARREELDALWELVLAANHPAPFPEEARRRLASLASRSFVDPRGEKRPWLTDQELEALSISPGSLSAAERREIESHVGHTDRFLCQIPWNQPLRRVPEIARGHHERLDGRGYPRGVKGEAVPLEARIMAIADVFDALTAADRPYRRAVSLEQALEILRRESEAGGLDPVLLQIFVEAQVYREVLAEAPADCR